MVKLNAMLTCWRMRDKTKKHHVLLQGIFESATPPAGGVPAVFFVSAPRLTPWATESGALRAQFIDNWRLTRLRLRLRRGKRFMKWEVPRVAVVAKATMACQGRKRIDAAKVTMACQGRQRC